MNDRHNLDLGKEWLDRDIRELDYKINTLQAQIGEAIGNGGKPEHEDVALMISALTIAKSTNAALNKVKGYFQMV